MGALNVESLTRLRPGAVPLLAFGADCLSRRLQRLGGLPPESRSQRLVRYATEVAGASTSTELSQTLPDAAMAISGSTSACLVVGRWPRVLAARGPSADLLSALSHEDLERFVLVPVTAGGESLGVLVAGDSHPRTIHPDTVESVELLARAGRRRLPLPARRQPAAPPGR